MHRQRKGGNFVLTTGFPESHVGKVMEQIIAAGGKIDRREYHLPLPCQNEVLQFC